MTAAVSTNIEVAEFAGQLFFRLWRSSHTRTAERLSSIGLTPALFALLNVLGAREGTIQQQLSSDMGIDPSAMVKLIDELEGAGLAERRRRPSDGKGRYPAVVDMEPYGRSTSTDYVPQGYARINTDVRGSGMSGGALCLLCLREQEDVRDVIEWIAKQPWSNGHVALYGHSYPAITALLGAALEPKHLDAVVVGHPPTDPYRDVVWQNGLFDQGFVYQWFAGQTAAQSIGIGYQPQILDRAQQQFAIETRLIPYDGPVYYERSVLRKVARIKVPVYVFTGWEDMFSRGDLRLIDTLRTRSMLVIDASTHHGTGEAGEIGTPYGGSLSDQLNNLGALNSSPPPGEDIAWLNRWVKKIHNGIEHKPRVRYFDLGGLTWHPAPSWHAADTHLTRL